MVTAEAYSPVDLDRVYNKLDEEIEEDWLKRLEAGFGDVDERHVFVQSDTFNGFLYRDRATLHILESDVEDPVYQVLDQFYDIDEG